MFYPGDLKWLHWTEDTSWVCRRWVSWMRENTWTSKPLPLLPASVPALICLIAVRKVLFWFVLQNPTFVWNLLFFQKMRQQPQNTYICTFVPAHLTLHSDFLVVQNQHQYQHWWATLIWELAEIGVQVRSHWSSQVVLTAKWCDALTPSVEEPGQRLARGPTNPNVPTTNCSEWCDVMWTGHL